MRDRAGLEAHDERVARHAAAERREQVAERHVHEDRDDREQQERERDRAGRGDHRREQRSHFFNGAFGRPKPAAFSSFRPRVDSTFLTNERPAAWFPLAFTIASS